MIGYVTGEGDTAAGVKKLCTQWNVSLVLTFTVQRQLIVLKNQFLCTMSCLRTKVLFSRAVIIPPH